MMNRRKFIQVLAGIPLLGLLVRVPEAEEKASYTFGNSALYEAAYTELQSGAEEQPPYELCGDIGSDSAEDWLVERYQDENGDWHERTLLGSPPPLHWPNDPTPGMSYWNGREWIGL